MILISSTIATFLMTAFSYLCGYMTGHQFREPELLNQLLKTSRIPVKVNKKSIIGWLLHLLIGFAFAVLIFLIGNYFEVLDNWIFGLISGVLAGIVGIIGWHIMFYLNPNPPDTHLKKFYIQLVVAHVIFSLSFIGFQILVS